MTKRILVTGSDGMVGSALREVLGDDTFFATRADADLRDFEATDRLFKEVQPTHVIHLAAVVGGIGGNIMHSGDFFRSNILINTNVLECARQNDVQRLVSFMSTCIFPAEASYPLSVEDLHNGPPHPSNFGYAYAKRMLDVQTRAYRAQWNSDFVIAVPTNIYGPHDNWNLEEGHVAPALIHKCYLAKQNNEPLMVWGSGNPLREFIYSGDVAKLATWVLNDYQGTEPIILTSGIEMPIKELVHLVADAMDFTGEIIFQSDKPDGQFRKPSNAQPLLDQIGGFDFTPVDVGIKRTVDWFVANYPNVRL